MKTIDLRNVISIKQVDYDENEYIIPNSGNIKELRMGLRPYNKQIAPKVYSEYKDNRIISHNYGHGGAGWILCFGSVNKSIRNFENQIVLKGIKISYVKECETVTVIGMGCIGLTTAILLIQNGYKDIKLIADKFDNLVSHVAAGSFRFPVPPLNTNNDKIEEIKNMMLEGYLTFLSIKKGKCELSKVFNQVTKDIKLYTDFETNGTEYLVEQGYLKKPEKAMLKYGIDSEMTIWEGETLIINTDRYMKQALNYIKLMKVHIEFKYINSFEELENQYIFNCTGYGSKKLNKDKEVFSGCGHGIVLQNQNNSDKFDFIISLSKVPSLVDTKYSGIMYFMPKSDGNYFLGVTNILDYDGRDVRRNKEEYKKIVIRAQAFFHGILPQLTSKNIKF